MSVPPLCPQCGDAIVELGETAGGICPRCLLTMALTRDDDDEKTGEAEQAYGNYRIIRLLGEGGMGTVYLAEQQEPITRMVALKVIKLGMDTREVIARFESERQALALMDHPNIAKVLVAGATPQGRPYFVMEYVPGVPITEYCDQCRMSNRQRLELFVQVCQAVQHAHQKGIIHRDIKPSNVLVWTQDGRPLPKVIDFGTAKAVDQRLTERTVFTELGKLIGTPEYMSPEQAQWTGEDVDTRTDIYSLGVLLYELLGGALPFDSKILRRAAYEEICRVIREDEPPRPSARFSSLGAKAGEVAHLRQTDVSALARGLRGDLDWIIMTAMAKERTRRYASASELAADIARHLGDEPVMASPPSTSYRLGKFIRKNRRAVLALTAVFLSLLLGLGTSTALYFRAENQRLEAQAQRAEAERQRAEAERQRADAVQERAEARRQGGVAESQRLLADRSRLTADEQRREAERQHAAADRERFVAQQQSDEARLRGAEAVQQRSAADKQREVAEQQTKTANEQRTAAERQRLLAQRQSYAANLIAADLHIRSNEIAEAKRRLFLCPPGMRGWEWRYLFWKCDTSLATLTGHTTVPARSKPTVGFSKDGARIFWVSSDAIYWWSASSGKPLADYRDLGQILAADRDGVRIVSASGRNSDTSLRVYDAASSKVVATLSGHSGEATCAAFNRGATRVVSGARDGSIRVWDAASGQPLAKLDGHKGDVWAVAFSSDGERIISAGEDHMVRIWDAGTGHAMYGIPGHGGPVLSIAFSPDRRTIVSGSADKTARIWDAATGRSLHTLTGHDCGVAAVAISPDGATIASGSCSTLRLWDASSGKLVAKLTAEWPSEIAAISFGPDGARIAAASAAGEIKMWNAITYGGGLLRRAGSDADRVAISPGGAYLATHNSKTQTLEMWDTLRRKSVWIVHGNDAKVTALAFSQDSLRLVTGSSNNAVRMWNATTGQPIGGSGGLPTPVTSLAFTADGSRLVAGSSDHAFSVWDTATNDTQKTLDLPASGGAILSLAWSPDKRRLVVGAEGSGDVGVWDAATGQLLALLKGHSASVDALTFTPDGGRIVSGSRDKTLRVWDASTYDPLLVMGDHDEAVASLSFSSDGARMYSASLDGTVRIWETRTAEK